MEMILKALVLAAMLAMISAPVFCEPAGGPSSETSEQAATPGSPGSDPKVFQDFKAEDLKNHKARAQVLQDAIACIEAANDPPRLRACHDKEHEQLRRISREQLERIRQQQRQMAPRQGSAPAPAGQ